MYFRISLNYCSLVLYTFYFERVHNLYRKLVEILLMHRHTGTAVVWNYTTVKNIAMTWLRIIIQDSLYPDIKLTVPWYKADCTQTKSDCTQNNYECTLIKGWLYLSTLKTILWYKTDCTLIQNLLLGESSDLH